MCERFDLHAFDQAHRIVDHLDDLLLVLLGLLLRVLLANVCCAMLRRYVLTNVGIIGRPTAHTF